MFNHFINNYSITLNLIYMKANMGTTDRTLRLVTVIAVAVCYFTSVISGTVALIAGIIAVIFLITSMVGVCPAYLPFGLSTLRKRTDNSSTASV